MKRRLISFALAVVMSLALAVPAFAAGTFPFTDVSAKAWYYADVSAVYTTGLFTGQSATAFDPDGELSIAQTVTLAARVHQYMSTGKVTLANGSDVWYSTFVNYAKQNGIIGSGCDGRWNDKATRAEMVQILYNALSPQHYQAINEVEDNAIPDVKLSYAYGEAVYAFYRAGILTGSSSSYANIMNVEGCFHPRSTIKRCEVAAILNRILNPGQRKTFTLALPELPGQDAELTEANVLALLDNLDPDGAWIIRSADSKNTGSTTVNGVAVDAPANFMRNFALSLLEQKSLGNSDDLETAVHEECHSFTLRNVYEGGSTARKEYIYIGDGEYITVPYTELFKTEEMSVLLPEGLRTSRYRSYISKGSPVASNVYGIYGLLNEFAAYCWGNNNAVKTYDYYATHWANSYTNQFVSYAEFRFWILSYMLYAKEKHPDVYQGVLANDKFRQAFSAIDDKFADVIQEYFGKLEAAGKNVHSEFKHEYDTLMKIMERPEYVEMAELLRP